MSQKVFMQKQIMPGLYAIRVTRRYDGMRNLAEDAQKGRMGAQQTEESMKAGYGHPKEKVGKIKRDIEETDMQKQGYKVQHDTSKGSYESAKKREEDVNTRSMWERMSQAISETARKIGLRK